MSVFELPTVTLIPNGIHHPPIEDGRLLPNSVKGMVAAEVSDERSAYMTRGHNNSRMITVGAEIVGDELAKNIAKGFVNGKYDGGRHQIRVDMLNKMC